MRFNFARGSGSEYGSALSVPSYRAAQPLLLSELRRARRYEYPLSVAILSAQPASRLVQSSNGTSRNGTRPEISPATYGLLGGFLRNTLRESDILAGLPESLAYASFLPGVGREGAEMAVDRFREGFLDCGQHFLRAGVATFPDDGLTIEDLVQCAIEAWRSELPSGAALSLTTRVSNG
jgi:hypothetical protein